MLLIKTKLKEFPGKGIGLIADEFLQKGTIWHIDENFFDKIYSNEFVKKNNLLDFFKTYATYIKETDEYYLCSDNARFVNHSNNPNGFYDINKKHCITICDIKIGEEITCDYANICDFNKEFGLDFENIEEKNEI